MSKRDRYSVEGMTKAVDVHSLSFISLISAPAANTLSPPVMTIALTLSSVSAFSSSALRALNKGVLSAFRAFGLLRVKMATLFEGEREGMTSCSAEVDMERMVNRYVVWEGLRRVRTNMIQRLKIKGDNPGDDFSSGTRNTSSCYMLRSVRGPWSFG